MLITISVVQFTKANYVYSQASMTLTSMACLPWLIRTRFLVPRKFFKSSRKQIFRKIFVLYHENECCVYSLESPHINYFPSEYTALGNMPVEKETCIDDCSYKTVRFQTTPRMSTYLLAFVISDFKYKETILPGQYAVSKWINHSIIHQSIIQSINESAIQLKHMISLNPFKWQHEVYKIH